MSDNVFSTMLLVLIAALAVVATVGMVDSELALRRAVAARAASATDAGTTPANETASPEAAAVREPEGILLPRVTVTGQRPLNQRQATSRPASAPNAS
jgi:hypothetical protein